MHIDPINQTLLESCTIILALEQPPLYISISTPERIEVGGDPYPLGIGRDVLFFLPRGLPMMDISNHGETEE